MPTTLRPGGRHAEWTATGPARWVLLDLDGTLVGTSGVVSDAVVAAVRAVADRGIRVGYATGRNVAGAEAVHEQLRQPGPHVVLNGAQVRLDGKPVRTWGISGEQLAGILQLCRDEGHYAELYTDDGVLVTTMDTRYQPHWTEVIGWPIGALDENPPATGPVIKATIVATDDDQVTGVLASLTPMGLKGGVATSPVTPGFIYINITREDVDKGHAITSAAEDLGIGLDEVVVIGDGANDLPMLAVAGTAIAMGDAPDVVRSAAHLVTGPVDADGAAQALRDVLTRC